MRELTSYAVHNRAWWILPTFVVLALLALALGTAHTTVPYALYTLF